MNERGPFTWTTLALPAPLTAEAATSAMQALAGLSGQPRIVLEAVGRSGRVSWRLGADQFVTPRILAALGAHLPTLRTSPARDGNEHTDRAGSIHLPGHKQAPLNVAQIEPVTRGILTALATASPREVVRLQVILGPRYQPRRIRDVEPRLRREATAKYGAYRFGCTLRIAATAASDERSGRLVEGVVAALRGLLAPGVGLQLRRNRPSVVDQARSPFLWPLELNVAEVAAVLGWPIASKPEALLPGVPASHPVALPIPANVPTRGRVLGLSALDLKRGAALSVNDSLRHLHVLGPTGVGKSTMMASLALQDIEAGRGVVVIDPKGDLVDDLLARMPESRQRDVVVLDPRDGAPVGVDAFAGEPDLAADALLGVFHSLYATNWGPRTHDILHACLLTLARRGDASLAMVPLLLTNPGFRRSVVQPAAKRDPMGLGSFWSWFDGISDGERTQAIAPLMNKLRPILMRPGLRAILGQRRPKFALSDVFTKRRILLVSLSNGTLGPEGAQLLGSVVVALLWQAALRRSAIAPARRHPVMVFIDEVQDYLRLPGDLGDALAQARGLGVGYTLAHQHLGQLTPNLQGAVMANARSRVAFQLSPSDAKVVASSSSGQLDARDLQALPAFHAYASLLVDGSTEPWCSLTTQPLAPCSAATATTVRALSQTSYGRPLDDIERDLIDLAEGSDRRDQTPLGRTPRAPRGDAT